MITKIYVDLDGVLADFDGHFIQMFGNKTREMGDDYTWERINQYEKTGNCWFLDLPKMKDSDKLMNYLNSLSGVHIYILTATGHNFEEHSVQKIIWAKTNFRFKGKDIFVVKKSELKGEYADDESILIDDSDRSINAFTENGGIGILHTSVDDTISKLKSMFGNAGIV